MAVLLAHLPPIRRAGWTMLWAVAGYGMATICLGFTTHVWMALAAMFVIGALDNVSVVVRHTLIQLLTPDDMRGRVTAGEQRLHRRLQRAWRRGVGRRGLLLALVPSIIGGGVGTILVVLACGALWPQILAIGSLVGLRPAEKEKRTPRAPP